MKDTQFLSMKLKDLPKKAKLERWKIEAGLDDSVQSNQHLPSGKDLQRDIRKIITILRTRVARIRMNTVK